jgi:BA14K-like protein
MKIILAPTILLSLLFASAPAFADKAAYCKAYARDFADQSAADETQWQHKYQIANSACMAKHISPKPLVFRPARPPSTLPPKPAPIVKAIEPKPVAVKPVALTAGSPEWNNYCAKKYVSFNAKTGTYKSKTGVERKCIVTN